jgi:hypothetical protein
MLLLLLHTLPHGTKIKTGNAQPCSHGDVGGAMRAMGLSLPCTAPLLSEHLL